MVKKTLLSLAIAASAAGMAGCQISSVEGNNKVDQTAVKTGVLGEGGTAKNATMVIYDPSGTNAAGLPNIPLITDLLLQGLGDPDGLDTDGAVDGTIPFASIPLGQDGYNPIFSAVSDMDGFSTSAAIDIAFDGPLNGGSIVTTAGPTANVLLVPMNYTDDPVTGGTLDAANPIGAPAAIEASVVSYSDIEGANNILRIMPSTPLQSATRYLVVVTSGVKDAAGMSVKASNTFELMAEAEEAPKDPTSNRLHGAIQSWVGLARQVGAAMQQQLAISDIAYATTFTTGGGTQVLGAMAAPSQVNAAVAQTAPAALRYMVEQELVKAPDDRDMATLGANLVGQGLTETQAQGVIGLASHMPQPAPRVATFTTQVADLSLLNGAISGGGSLPQISMANGSIKLPYYLSAPDVSSTANLGSTAIRTFAGFWQADDTLGTDLSALLTANGIEASDVTPRSTNVTRHFPLAKTGSHTSETNPQGYVDVPVSVYYSAAASCDNGRNPIIYQHGITSNRTAAIPFTANMLAADPCYAVVAIDLPMHGIEPFDATGGVLLSQLYPSPVDLTGDGEVDSKDAVIRGMFAQRHFGLTQDIENSGQPRAMVISGSTPELIAADAAANDTGAKDYDLDGNVDGIAGDGFYDNAGSGSLFINIANFQNTRDNMRQAVMDLLNLNASVKFLDFDGTAGVDINEDATVKFAGHSLGGIIGTNFVALSNALGGTASTYVNRIESSVLANPGGNMSKLIENSFAFGPAVLGGFKQLGEGADLNLSQGSSLMELTMHIFQATLDSADPINFGTTLQASAADTAVLMYEVARDTAVPPAAFEANGLKPAVELDDDTANDVLADTAASPLAGTTPLAAASGLTAVAADTGDGTASLRTLVRFNTGTHTSFGLTTDAVGAEMMGQVRTFYGSGGKLLDITDESLIAPVPASN